MILFSWLAFVSFHVYTFLFFDCIGWRMAFLLGQTPGNKSTLPRETGSKTVKIYICESGESRVMTWETNSSNFLSSSR